MIDDNPNKWGRVMEGVPIVGGREDILINVKKYKIDQILFGNRRRFIKINFIALTEPKAAFTPLAHHIPSLTYLTADGLSISIIRCKPEATRSRYT